MKDERREPPHLLITRLLFPRADRRRQVALAVALCVLLLLLGSTRADMFLFPSREIAYHPGKLGLRYETVGFENKKGKRLHGWFIPAQPIRQGGQAAGASAAGAILVCHGNAGNVGYFLDYPFFLARSNFHVLLFDYQGFGQSAGRASVRALQGDVESALAYLLSRGDVDRRRVALLGISLGTAMCLKLAAHQPDVKALVLEGAFIPKDDLYYIYDQIAWKAIAWPMSRITHFLFVPRNVSPLDDVRRLDKTPALFIHGDRDTITSLKSARKLHDLKPGAKEFVLIEGAGHTPEPHMLAPQKVESAVLRFLRTHLK
ncbi:MAG: alpha/beta fold hydrolase [Planctomycetes bacterium]|nr:alpha/beta fold hydrolase [Planctomycetota bacterium]MBM4082241.1 alpha/beta fold hydrolase [Planctomycetota bacterium]